MATIQIKRGLQEAVSRLSLAQGELAVALDTGNVYVGVTSGNVHVNPAGGTADTAVTLQTPRDFSITGDGTAPAVSFDGSANVVLNFSLSEISTLAAGTYTKVTVDGKGRVTAGDSISITDLPNIPASKITGLGTAATANVGTQTGNVVSVQSDGKIISSLIPDLSSSYAPTTRTINGLPLSSDITLSAANVGAVATSSVGVAGGVASLDSSGLVPSSQLPSYVDDVLEFENLASFPETGKDGVIYIAKDTNLTYRWSGSQYVEISPSLALGTTSSTAFRGDYGQIAYNHSQITDGNPHGVTYTMVGAAPESHVTVQAPSSQLGHVKIGDSFSITGDGVLTLTTVDGGTFS